MQKASPLLSLLALSTFMSTNSSMFAAQSVQQSTTQRTIERGPFGQSNDGQIVDLYTLKNTNGLTAKVITYGAIIYSFEVPGRNGECANVTANCASIADYENRSPCFGALIGRYANRIAAGKFSLEGPQLSLPLNGGANHIHGGPKGFDKQVWKAEPIKGDDFVGLKLSYVSKDGENGYPGTLNCTVVYELNNRNEWKMDYTAIT